MGCNCKVNKEIMKIHKDYGKTINIPWKEHAKFKIEETIKIICLGIFGVLSIPFIIVIVVLLMVIGKTHFNVNKLLNILLRNNTHE